MEPVLPFESKQKSIGDDMVLYIRDIKAEMGAQDWAYGLIICYSELRRTLHCWKWKIHLTVSTGTYEQVTSKAQNTSSLPTAPVRYQEYCTARG